MPWQDSPFDKKSTIREDNYPDLKTFVTKQIIGKPHHDNDFKFPKFSIVTPSYNQGHFLERTILSVLNQNISNLEFIIIDGGSTDESVEIIKKYEQFLAFWVSEPDQGQSDALNKGFQHATGDIFGWLNADDLLCPGALHTVAEAFIEHEDKAVVFGDYFSIDKNDAITSLNFAFDFNLFHFIYEGFHLNSQATFWRASLHQKFGEFDASLHRTMDYDMLLRFGLIAGNKSFLRINTTLACFRRHEDQKTKGADSLVDFEQRHIANKLGIHLKFTVVGKMLRLFYRLRRAYWYVKRGGLDYAGRMIAQSIYTKH